MSSRVVLGTSLALILICPTWSAGAEPKSKLSSIASDRHASASRSADKEDADKERSRKGRAQREEDSEKKSARNGRAQKEEDAERKSAGTRRAQKDHDSEKKSTGTKRGQKEEDSERKSTKIKPAQKEVDTEKKSTRTKRAQKEEDPERKSTKTKRAQKEDDSEKKSAGPKRAQKEEESERKSARNGRAQKDTASEPSPDDEIVAALKRQLRDLRKQVADMERLRAELAAIKAQVRGSTPKPTIWGGVPLTLAPSLSRAPSGSPEIAALALPFPDIREVDPRPLQPPVNHATASLPAVIREQLPTAAPPKSAVEEAKAYLVMTATPGYTMMRQGVSVAIDRLHPGFAVKLAEAVRRAREEGMTQAGVFSAYRPPAFGVGGFADKFDSLHSYGLATDITGIGRAGSASAHRWHQIVMDVGLYLPYGPDNGTEFNHAQFVPVKIAPRELRGTITADGPIDLREMWLASGVDAYVTEPSALAVAGSPAAESSTKAVSGEPGPVAPMPPMQAENE